MPAAADQPRTYLVTMSLYVHEAASSELLERIRTLMTSAVRQLSSSGHLLRLWQPPLPFDEWRTLGLFLARDRRELDLLLDLVREQEWRMDRITPLESHPDDPLLTAARNRPGSDFLTTFTLRGDRTFDDGSARGIPVGGARRATESPGGGHLLRLWTLPGRGRALGLWRADDAGQLHTVLSSLSIDRFVELETVPLRPHPDDPGRQVNRAPVARQAG